MNFGEYARVAGRGLKTLGGAAAAIGVLPGAVLAQEAAAPAVEGAQAAASAYQRMAPTEGKGMPVPEAIGLQAQYSPLGEYGAWMHHGLVWVMGLISLLVLVLLLVVMVRFRAGRNPVPSKTTHNTTIEVLWTLVPVLILVGIAIPSIDLLAKQFQPAPEKALTVKITGNQWYWTYGFPDNGGFEYTSYMLNLPGQPKINAAVREVGSDPSDGPSHLEVDNRLVLPVGEPIRLQITASDVIHAFAVPSLWFKLDAVPGRINEKVLFIKEPGIYYGQCSELCGARHGYMPIAIEALPRDKFNAWLLSQPGGTLGGEAAPAASEAAPAAAAPAAGPAAAASAPAPEASASAAPAA